MLTSFLHWSKLRKTLNSGLHAAIASPPGFFYIHNKPGTLTCRISSTTSKHGTTFKRDTRTGNAACDGGHDTPRDQTGGEAGEDDLHQQNGERQGDRHRNA
jgi:hypothetical protein